MHESPEHTCHNALISTKADVEDMGILQVRIIDVYQSVLKFGEDRMEVKDFPGLRWRDRSKKLMTKTLFEKVYPPFLPQNQHTQWNLMLVSLIRYDLETRFT